MRNRVLPVFSSLFAFALLLSSLAAQGSEDRGKELRDAAGLGDLSKVKALIDAKVDVNAPSEYGVTPLALACDHGHDAVVAALLQAGATPNTKDQFYRVSPLGWAVSKKRTSIVKLLVEADAQDIDGPLSWAVANQDEVSTATLLQGKRLTLEGKQSAYRAAHQAKWEKGLKLFEPSMTEAERAEAIEPKKKVVDREKFNGVAGTYQSESGKKIYIKVLEDRLELSDPEFPDRPFRLALGDDGLFTARGIEASFVREGSSVKSMRWKAGEQSTLFARVAEADAPPASPDKKEDKNNLLDVPTNPSSDIDLGGDQWPGFRGPMARGINNHKPLPREWDAKENKNILWKTPIPGLGTSSPIVWGDRVFLTTALRESDTKGFRVGAYGDVESSDSDGECQFIIMALDLSSGQVLWQKEATRAMPTVKRHPKSSHANPTPVTDGKSVIAFFGGNGIYCFDWNGELRWSRQLGTLDSGWFYDRSYQWGFGSSPVLFEESVIVQCDVHDGSFIAALDLKTGEIKWKTERNEIPTWSSPVVYQAADGVPRVYVAGTKSTAAYHARTGALIWQMGGFSEIVVPTPQVTSEFVLMTSGYSPIQPIVAIDHTASGTLKMPTEKTGVSPFRWNLSRGGPYMPTPIIANDRLYVMDDGGILSVYSAKDGTRMLRQRVRNAESTSFTASPVSGDGHLYMTSEVGTTFVVPLNGEVKVIATNSVGESVLATPAIAKGKILIRGEKHLFAIGKGEG